MTAPCPFCEAEVSWRATVGEWHGRCYECKRCMYAPDSRLSGPLKVTLVPPGVEWTRVDVGLPVPEVEK